MMTITIIIIIMSDKYVTHSGCRIKQYTTGVRAVIT